MRKIAIVGITGLALLLGGCHDPQPQLPTPVQELFDKDGNPVAQPQVAQGDSGYSGTEMLMMGAAAGMLGNAMGKSSAAAKAPRTVFRETTVIKKVVQPRKPNYMTQPRKPPSKFTSGSTFKSSTRSFTSSRRR